ncbi:hypothetical protein IJG12_01945 [Candidatus Saccharibacteria bacterium]|nr:hypothetical protein [Candidatus Saccharibacteria bacterium]
MKNNILINTTLVLLTTTIFFGVELSSGSSSATSASTALASVKVAASCTLSTSGGGNYSATVPNGTSAEIAGSTMSVSCNDAGGFALYAVGYSDDTVGNNNMIGSSTNIPTNTSGTNSYWAMKINPTSGTTPTIENSFNNYHIVPDIHTKVASYASSTGTGSLSVNATYKANISSTQLAGNYLGKVKYTLIHPSSGPAPAAPLAASDCPARSICYAPNADDIEGTMLGTEFSAVAASPKAGRQTNVPTNSTVDLRAYNYSRPSYGFAGWSPKYDAEVNTSDIIYGPQATISTNPNDPEGVDVSTNGLILYPVWVASTGTMQSFTYSTCNSMNIGDVTARTDSRDDEVYAIAKLADGKCWMIENLRLDYGANITPSNTQSNNGAFGGVFTGLAMPENANFDNVNPPIPNSLYGTENDNRPNIIAGGHSSYYAYRIPRYNNNNTLLNSGLTPSYKGNGNNLQWYGYGNYYTWAAANADTNFYEIEHNRVLTSICPMGWILPTGGNNDDIIEDNNDYYLLASSIIGTEPNQHSNNGDPYWGYSSNEYYAAPIAMKKYPNNFVLSKKYINTRSSINDEGYYWTSSTSMYSNTSYIFYITQSKVSPSESDLLYDGFSVRCFTQPQA